MTTEDENHIIRTTGRRMAKGLAIIVVMIAFGAAIAVPNWHNFAKNPPPVSTITTKTASAGGAEGGTTSAAGGTSGAAGGGGTAASSQPTAVPAGATAITILAGASVQGNPNYDPSDSKAPLGGKIVWQNKDNTVHTATAGTGPTDPNSGKTFDTKMINAGSNSDPIEIKNVKVGDALAYYCQIHPYMTAKLTITAASSSSTSNASSSPTPAGASGAAAGTASSSGAAASGPTLSIPQGASVQGNPSYEPASLSVKKGDTVQVQNKDQSPHTVTSGKTLEDPNKGKDFDTSIIAPSASGKVSTASLNPGDHPFHCDLHPYMTGTLKVQ